MENYFANLFEDVRHERSLILLLSLTDWIYFKTIWFYRKWNWNNKKYCSSKNYKDKLTLKQYIAMQFDLVVFSYY